MGPNFFYCLPELNLSRPRMEVIRIGRYFRKSDHKLIQRYKCLDCERSFSDATSSLCFNQKKRQINSQLFMLFATGISHRNAARFFKVTRKTIARKLEFLGNNALEALTETNKLFPKSQIVEFDDLETIEHSKCKPLSVTMAVEFKTRRILSYRVSRMPAKGLLAKMARKKYGFRKDERPKARRELFQELSSLVEKTALFKSDEHPGYPRDLKIYFPNCQHQTFKSRKAGNAGQGELRDKRFDPIFSLNHSFAMLRAHINRLFRRTWNTTKDPKRLSDHIAIYALYHNLVMIQKKIN
jgi:transposase-like protein